MKQRLLFGNWDYEDNPDMLCTYDEIDSCFSNEHVPSGQRAITADIAMQGSDKFVIIVWEGFRAIEIKSISKSDGPKVEQTIRDTANRHAVPKHRIVFDADGVGSFVEGYIKGAKAFHGGGKTKGTDKDEYHNLKSQ